jgi:hypothetical protein
MTPTTSEPQPRALVPVQEKGGADDIFNSSPQSEVAGKKSSPPSNMRDPEKGLLDSAAVESGVTGSMESGADLLVGTRRRQCSHGVHSLC